MEGWGCPTTGGPLYVSSVEGHLSADTYGIGSTLTAVSPSPSELKLKF
jgi:hypothetical protein